MLPGRDGLAIVRALRDRQVPTLVLMLTASDSVDDVVAGLRAGADDYLVKRVRMAELLARLHSLERRAERSPMQDSASPGGPCAWIWTVARLRWKSGP